MLALVVGTLLAVGALAYVLYPLLVGPVPVRRAARPAAPSAHAAEHEAVVALREIEFDRVTGKLSDADYAELKTRYTARALEAMRADAASAGRAAGSAADADEAIEAAVRAYRERMRRCATCGPRPEPDAVYCSNCGLYLAGVCESCGASVTESGATFCASCGTTLAA
jgi:double zinc ribbon protein